MRYQWEEGGIDPDKRTPQFLEDIWKEWGETWIWQNTEGLLDVSWILEAIIKGTLIMVIGVSYHPNLDYNIDVAAW